MKNYFAFIRILFLDSWMLISLGAVALAWGTCTQLMLSCNAFPLLLLVYAGTFLSYNLHRVVKFNRLKVEFNWHRRWYWIAIIFHLLLLLITLVQLHPITLLMLIPLALATVLYTLPAQQVPRWLLIRQFPFAKVFLVSGVWSLVTVLIPVLESSAPVNQSVLVLVLASRFIFFIGLTIPFDVRDQSGDAQLGIKTLPVVLGESASYSLAIILTMLFMLIHIFAKWLGSEDIVGLIPVLLTGALLASLLFCKKCRSHPLYFSFWLDGLILLYGLMLIGADLLR